MENTMTSSFNINYIEPTNQDVTVVFTPDSSVMRYTYSVYKDENLQTSRTVENGNNVEFVLDETGTYKITVELFDFYNQKTILESGEYKIDKESPIIKLGSKTLQMKVGDVLYPMGDVEAYDKQDGNLIQSVTTNLNELNLDEIGIKRLVYRVTDQAGNTATETMIISVVKNDTFGIMMFQIGIISVLLVALIGLIKSIKTVRLEKRICKYSIEPLRESSMSVLDKYQSFYEKVLKRISVGLNKSVFLRKYASRYEKYIGVIGSESRSAMDFVADKFITAFVFVLIAICSFTVQLKLMSLYEFVLPFIVGFFVSDLLYISKYRFHKKRIENDLLQAIIIMNNAFKSGRSITQAIDLVVDELEGAIATEFRKMRMELSFGLSIDVVFKRFSERVDLEEINYLTASLSILNKTGGNIIKVFSSIEESLFNKKKLRLELDSLTGSSKMIMYVLFCVPIFFVVFVTAVNPTYFVPFFASTLGIILLFIIIILYVVYIICVKKIMKVRI